MGRPSASSASSATSTAGFAQGRENTRSSAFQPKLRDRTPPASGRRPERGRPRLPRRGSAPAAADRASGRRQRQRSTPACRRPADQRAHEAGRAIGRPTSACHTGSASSPPEREGAAGDAQRRRGDEKRSRASRCELADECRLRRPATRASRRRATATPYRAAPRYGIRGSRGPARRGDVARRTRRPSRSPARVAAADVSGAAGPVRCGPPGPGASAARATRPGAGRSSHARLPCVRRMNSTGTGCGREPRDRRSASAAPTPPGRAISEMAPARRSPGDPWQRQEQTEYPTRGFPLRETKTARRPPRSLRREAKARQAR